MTRSSPVGSADGTVQPRDGIGRAIQILQFPGQTNALAFSPGNEYLGVASKSGTFVAFVKPNDHDLNSSTIEVRAFACSQMSDSMQTLSADEWQRYFGSEPVRYTCGPSVLKLLGQP